MIRKSLSAFLVVTLITSNTQILFAAQHRILSDEELDEIHAGGLNFDFNNVLGSAGNTANNMANGSISNTSNNNLPSTSLISVGNSKVQFIQPPQIISKSSNANENTVKSPLDNTTPPLKNDILNSKSNDASSIFNELSQKNNNTSSSFSSKETTLNNTTISNSFGMGGQLQNPIETASITQTTDPNSPVEIPPQLAELMGVVSNFDNSASTQEDGLINLNDLATIEALKNTIAQNQNTDNAISSPININTSSNTTAPSDSQPLQLASSTPLNDTVLTQPLASPSSLTPAAETNMAINTTSSTNTETSPMQLASNATQNNSALSLLESGSGPVNSLTSSETNPTEPITTPGNISNNPSSQQVASNNTPNPSAPIQFDVVVDPKGGVSLGLTNNFNPKDNLPDTNLPSTEDLLAQANSKLSLGSSGNGGLNVVNVADQSQQFLSSIVTVNSAGSTVPVQINLTVIINSTVGTLSNVNDLKISNFTTFQFQ